MPPKAWQLQRSANARALNEILGSEAKVRVDLSASAAMSVRLTQAALSRIYATPDPRLLRISINKVVAQPLLTTSTVLTNMPPAWNLGYRAAGQTIVVYDTGVLKSHSFFSMNGAPKISYEFCAGTDSTSGPLRSICPGRPAEDTTGDSPLNFPACREPPSLLSCPVGSTWYSACTHGTHVAGIASGRNNSNFVSGFQGIAPDAALIAAQVFSFDPANAAGPGMFRDDMLMGIQTLVNETTTDAYIASMSVGQTGSRFAVDCGLGSNAGRLGLDTEQPQHSCRHRDRK